MSVWHYTVYYADYPLRYSAWSGRLRVRVLWRDTWRAFDYWSPFDALEQLIEGSRKKRLFIVRLVLDEDMRQAFRIE